MRIKAPFRVEVRESRFPYRRGIRSHGGECRWRAEKHWVWFSIPNRGVDKLLVASFRKVFGGWERIA